MANIFGQKPEGKKPQKRGRFRGQLSLTYFSNYAAREFAHVRDYIRRGFLCQNRVADLQRDEAVLLLWANVALGCECIESHSDVATCFGRFDDVVDKLTSTSDIRS